IGPTLRGLHRLGGSGSIHGIENEIVSDLGLSEELANFSHGKGSQTEVGYRAAWARTALKHAKFIENSDRGVWVLTATGAKKVKEADSNKLVRRVLKMARLVPKLRRLDREIAELKEGQAEEDSVEELDWRDRLLEVLLKMDPIAFERLCQRLLRESGFLEVEVTRRSGDGGIDGHGTIRIGGLISFNVLFQSAGIEVPSKSDTALRALEIGQIAR
ncbi:MAG: Mrr restriction system protein, partial [bacterium]|nr:Mrr restriction system protein [bacterium]